MDDVGCSGSEDALLQCSHARNHNCNHNKDAGVRCQPCEFVLMSLIDIVLITDFTLSHMPRWRCPTSGRRRVFRQSGSVSSSKMGNCM